MFLNLQRGFWSIDTGRFSRIAPLTTTNPTVSCPHCDFRAGLFLDKQKTTVRCASCRCESSIDAWRHVSDSDH
jgi:hypothetical protein